MKMKIKNKILASFGILIVLVFVIVVGNFQTYGALDSDSAFINYSGRLRATSYRLGFLANAVSSDPSNHLLKDEMKETIEIFDTIVTGVQDGNPELGLEKLTYQPSIDQIAHFENMWLTEFKPAFQDVLSSGDINSVTFINTGINDFVKLINEMVNDYSAYSHQKVENAKISNSILTMIALLVGGLSFYFLNKGINRPIGFLTADLKDLSEGSGDLTKRIDTTTKDEIAEMTDLFNQFLGNIHDIVVNIAGVSTALSGDMNAIANTTEELTKSTEMIAVSAMDVADGSSMQNDQLEELNLLAENLKNEIINVSEKASQTLKASEESQQSVEKGNAQVNVQANELNEFVRSITETSQKVEDLNQSSEQIKAMVELIQNISSQTNLLALNASIEAAGAGEAGRGFAVVAEEIRKLAEETARSATQINHIVGDISNNTLDVKVSMDELVDQTKRQELSMDILKDELKEILNRSTMTLKESQGIMDISTKVSGDFNIITDSVDTIKGFAVNNSNNTQDVASAVEEQTAAFEEVSANINSMDEMANKLNDIVGIFKI